MAVGDRNSVSKRSSLLRRGANLVSQQRRHARPQSLRATDRFHHDLLLSFDGGHPIFMRCNLADGIGRYSDGGHSLSFSLGSFFLITRKLVSIAGVSLWHVRKCQPPAPTCRRVAGRDPRFGRRERLARRMAEFFWLHHSSLPLDLRLVTPSAFTSRIAVANDTIASSAARAAIFLEH